MMWAGGGPELYGMQGCDFGSLLNKILGEIVGMLLNFTAPSLLLKKPRISILFLLCANQTFFLHRLHVNGIKGCKTNQE